VCRFVSEVFDVHEFPPLSLPVLKDSEPKYLLPPRKPGEESKKCIIIALDETLVHSSFKVGGAGGGRGWKCM